MGKLFKVAVLPGDGIGPEVMAEALRCWMPSRNATMSLSSGPPQTWAGRASTSKGRALPETTVNICKASDAILFGSVGGPKWETLPRDEQPERGALLPLRKIFGLYANLRPAIIFPSLTSASSLKEEVIARRLRHPGDPRAYRRHHSPSPKGSTGKGATGSASTPCATASRDRAHHPCRLPGRPQARQEGLLHRQGQRALHLRALARDRDHHRARVPGRRALPHVRGQRRHAAGEVARSNST